MTKITDGVDENWKIHDEMKNAKGTADNFAQTNSKQGPTPYGMTQTNDGVLVRGMVVDENAHALDNVDVVFMDQFRNKALYRTRTERTGEWFLRVPSDQYVICFSKDDMYDEVQYLSIIPDIDYVQEYETVQLGFNPPEFRITGVEKYYIKCLRTFLRDKNPNEVRIKSYDGESYLYSDEDLVIFAHMALNDVNAYPAKTDYSLHQIPLQWRTLVIMGASIFSLISRGLLENMNQFNYSDAGLSLTLQRAGHFQATESALFPQYVEMKTKIKAQWKVRPHVVTRGAPPFHIRSFSPRQWRLR